MMAVCLPFAFNAMTADAADIVDTAVAAGSFETLVAAVQAADLVDVLKGEGPFTVFAPTDEAFAALPEGTVESLLAPENRDQLVAILTYHVVPGVRPGGTVAFYVWDYPGGGMGMMRAFWTAAIALDPGAADLGEDRRFPDCRPETLAAMAVTAGLEAVRTAAIEALTVFGDFDDYWQPFTLGAGPAPGYCAKLPAEARQSLRARLDADLPRNEAGAIALTARAGGEGGAAPLSHDGDRRDG